MLLTGVANQMIFPLHAEYLANENYDQVAGMDVEQLDVLHFHM
jgi:hypothetical protein